MNDLQKFSLLSLSFISVSLIFIFISSNGGAWSTYSSNVKLGLLQVTVDDTTYNYADLDVSHSIFVDGGRTISAFLVLGCLSAFVNLVLVLMIWPFKRSQYQASRYILIPASAAMCCIALCWIVWASLQQRRLLEEPFAHNSWDTRLGYCWALTFMAWLFLCVNIGLVAKLRSVAADSASYDSAPSTAPSTASVPYQTGTSNYL